MHGHTIIFAVFGLIISVQSASIEETCSVVPNGTYIADPVSSKQFVYCLNGKPNKGICPDNYSFDVNEGICNYPDKVIVRPNTIDTMCKNLDDEYFPDPKSCNKYVYCKEGVAQSGDCKEQTYNPNLNSCVNPSSSFDCYSSDICELIADETYLNDDSSCEGYITCRNGKAYAGKCRSGFYFNPKKFICDYEENVSCGTTTKPDDKFDLSSFTCPSVDGYVSDGQSCRGSVLCKDSIALTWTQCQSGTHFNEGYCKNIDSVACKHNRCDGLPDGYFVAVAGSNCESFNWCKQGEYGNPSPENCKRLYIDYPYFDEKNQLCVKSEPNYKVCKK